MVSGAIALWVTIGDTQLANSARTAASAIHDSLQNRSSAIFFDGRWGFQYNMQGYGARPVDVKKLPISKRRHFHRCGKQCGCQSDPARTYRRRTRH